MTIRTKRDKIGESKSLKKFAWLPTEIFCNGEYVETIWLEFYIAYYILKEVEIHCGYDSYKRVKWIKGNMYFYYGNNIFNAHRRKSKL